MQNKKNIDAQVLKKFEIVEIMGESNNSIVWKAIHKTKKILCAIKKCINCFSDKHAAQRTYREIEILSFLQGHENIVSFYEVIITSTFEKERKQADSPLKVAGTQANKEKSSKEGKQDHLNNHHHFNMKENKEVYLVFEFVQSDLEKVIRAHLLKESNIDYIFYKLLKAIHFFHTKKIIHRDIKPSNILIDQYSEPRIADFGLARTFKYSKRRKLESETTKNSKALASPFESIASDENIMNLTDYVASRWYRAPEILLGSVNYSYSSDIWSLGCVFGRRVPDQARCSWGEFFFKALAR